MHNDGQIIHHLWWLRKYLDAHFNDQTYAEIINQKLDTDTLEELDRLVAHIKLNY
jgi:hypothetical protein